VNPEKALAALGSGQKWGARYTEVQKLLNAFDFTYVRKTGHTHLWKCDELKDHPEFPTGRLQIGAHFDGKQGQVSPNSIDDAVSACRWVERVRRERKEQEDKKKQ